MKKKSRLIPKNSDVQNREIQEFQMAVTYSSHSINKSIIVYRGMSAPKNTQSRFFIYGTHQNCYYSSALVDFTSLSRPNGNRISITPKYNNDSHYFTDAFINPYDEALRQKTHKEDINVKKKRFLQRVKNFVNLPDEQNIKFNPRSIHRCTICSVNFVSYWEHINQESHKSSLKKRKANIYIHEMCEKYKEERRDQLKNKSKAEKNERLKRREIQRNKEDREYGFLLSIPNEFVSIDMIQASTNGVANLEQKN